MSLPLGYLSVSQIRTYLRCPAQYEFRYVRGFKSPVTSSFLLGSSFHSAIETANRAKMENGEILSTDDVLDAYSQAWERRLEQEEIEWEEGEDQGKTKDRGAEMTAAYYEEYGRNLKPAMVETHFIGEIEGVPFQGYIDLAEVDGSIRDFKTAKRTPQEDEVEKSIQLVAYALAYRELTGEKEAKVGLDYTVSLKSGIKVVRLETEIDDQRIQRFKRLVKGVADSIKAGIFYPNEEGFGCSFCPYRDICKGGCK